MWSFTMKKYFVTPVIVAIYLNNAHITWVVVLSYKMHPSRKLADHSLVLVLMVPSL